MARKGGNTPDWLDEFFDLRDEISEDQYTFYWRRLNRVRRDREEWSRVGREIVAEIKSRELNFSARDFKTRRFPKGSVRAARQAAQRAVRDNPGSRIVRRDSRGRFNRRGRTFQVVLRKNT